MVREKRGEGGGGGQTHMACCYARRDIKTFIHGFYEVLYPLFILCGLVLGSVTKKLSMHGLSPQSYNSN